MGCTSGDSDDVFKWQFDIRVLVLLGLLMTAGACGGDDNSVTQPPPTSSVTETFTDVLTLNGSRVHTFTVTSVGGITVLLTSLTPDSTKPIAMSLGTWNGSICQLILFNPASIQGSVVVGQTTATGQFCVLVNDPGGTVTEPQTYVIDVFYQVAAQ